MTAFFLATSIERVSNNYHSLAVEPYAYVHDPAGGAYVTNGAGYSWHNDAVSN